MDDETRHDEVSRKELDRAEDESQVEEDRSWDESFYRFSDQIERGEWPIEVPFAIELGFDGRRPRTRRVMRNVSPDDHGTPERPLLHVNVRLDQSKMVEIALEHIAAAERRGLSRLVGLLVLARIDRASFLRHAAGYFAEALAAGDEALRDDATLSDFIVDLHHREADLVVELVERTIGADRAAGKRLRDVIMGAVNEPPCGDALGLLAVAELNERLEVL
jgi:hypothetical protein